jgi:hypothetical protein
MLQTHLGPARQAFESLSPAERERLEGDLADLVKRMNRSGDGTMVVPSDYMESWPPGVENVSSSAAAVNYSSPFPL